MVPEVDLDMFAVAHADDALVIDAREPYEYIAEHVPGAKLAPVARLPHQADGLPATEPPHGPTRGPMMPATVTMATRQAGVHSPHASTAIQSFSSPSPPTARRRTNCAAPRPCAHSARCARSA